MTIADSHNHNRIDVKFWNKHADIKVNEGDNVTIKNVVTNEFHYVISANSTPETTYQVPYTI